MASGFFQHSSGTSSVPMWKKDSTLCQSCSTRWKSGHTGPPPTNDDGKYVCELCDRTFDNITGLGSHRGRCDGGMWRCGWCNCNPSTYMAGCHLPLGSGGCGTGNCSTPEHWAQSPLPGETGKHTAAMLAFLKRNANNGVAPHQLGMIVRRFFFPDLRTRVPPT
mgnify:CR=1 FL=1